MVLVDLPENKQIDLESISKKIDKLCFMVEYDPCEGATFENYMFICSSEKEMVKLIIRDVSGDWETIKEQYGKICAKDEDSSKTYTIYGVKNKNNLIKKILDEVGKSESDDNSESDDGSTDWDAVQQHLGKKLNK